MKTTDKLSESANKAFDKIANSTNEATEALGEKASNGELPQLCRDNPINTLGIAVAVGFLLSRVMSGR